MNRRLALRHPGGRSEIRVGEGALSDPALAEWTRDRTIFLVSSRPILDLHEERLSGAAPGAVRWIVLEVPDGETAKCVAEAERLWSRMLREGGKRDSRILAFGGGSVGDLAGFVAGAFLRGIACAQLPTTLLAQVDAAVGGKTAVDLPEAKNSVGLFHHPELVIADTSLLASLPGGELRSGLVEVIKMAALLDPPLLERVEVDLESLLQGDAAALTPVVAGAVAAKVAVVEADPEEGDRRQVLNFGHTLAHAIEAALDYRGLRHGEAVAYGMLFALRLAERRGWARELGLRLRELLARLALPALPGLEVERLLPWLARDKKARETGLVWVLPEALGRDRFVAVPAEEVAEELADFLVDPWAVRRG